MAERSINMNEKMINKYNIKLNADKDKLVVDKKIGKSAKDTQYVKDHKKEIVDILIQRERAEEESRLEKARKIESIEGLVELQTAISDWSDYRNAMNRYIERDCTGKAPIKPDKTVEELREMYPRAAAYITADQWSYSAHYYKASCGDRAKAAILDGQNYKDVIADMKSAWSNYTDEHMFD